MTAERPSGADQEQGGRRVPVAFRASVQELDLWAKTAVAIGTTPTNLMRTIMGDKGVPSRQIPTSMDAAFPITPGEPGDATPVVFRVQTTTFGGINQARERTRLGIGTFMRATMNTVVRDVYEQAGIDPDAPDAHVQLRAHVVAQGEGFEPDLSFRDPSDEAVAGLTDITFRPGPVPQRGPSDVLESFRREDPDAGDQFPWYNRDDGTLREDPTPDDSDQ